jgi:hypothetical protein
MKDIFTTLEVLLMTNTKFSAGILGRVNPAIKEQGQINWQKPAGTE